MFIFNMVFCFFFFTIYYANKLVFGYMDVFIVFKIRSFKL